MKIVVNNWCASLIIDLITPFPVLFSSLIVIFLNFFMLLMLHATSSHSILQHPFFLFCNFLPLSHCVPLFCSCQNPLSHHILLFYSVLFCNILSCLAFLCSVVFSTLSLSHSLSQAMDDQSKALSSRGIVDSGTMRSLVRAQEATGKAHVTIQVGWMHGEEVSAFYLSHIRDDPPLANMISCT